MVLQHPFEYILVVFHIIYAMGIGFAVHALMNCRTAQGTVAWVVSLLSLPVIAVPLYLIFGRNKFYGYVETIRTAGLHSSVNIDALLMEMRQYTSDATSKAIEFKAFERLAEMPFIKNNHVELLINGKATFDAILADIHKAEHYILIQFYIVRDDGLGTEIKEALLKKADEGVKVFFVYDEIGSSKLSSAYITEMKAHKNIQLHRFKTTQGIRNRFQLNFRNHRKIVIIDGHTAFIGGHNIGDEYLGKDPKFGPWRDTHCKIRGPVVQEVQVIFLDDWFWAERNIPELNWKPQKTNVGQSEVLALASGPADRLETGTLFFAHAIQMAKQRIWIATPYFVPDATIIDALQLAALQGIDVRIIIPKNPDSYLPYLAAFSYLPEVEESGIKIYRYKEGFMHQKVILIDDHLASVGTANFDNRSMRLNFEISMLIKCKHFAAKIEKMLLTDLEHSYQCTADDYEQKSFWFKVAVKFFRLLSPVL